ncbi:hypothetical protein [Pinirhizobacter sp.]|jgi:hypothetical protein|uniref:hypothetical protein n=1 Tax=Pinirhizobacter sp. TaxID=2950432 RepID=UPI002F3FFD97
MNTRLCLALAVPLVIAAVPIQARAADRWGGIDRWTPVSDARLAQARGGFDIGNGLMASFGFDRTVTINGVTTTIANVQIPDIAKMTKDQAQALEAATRAQLVQNGPGNAVSAPIVASPGSSTTITQGQGPSTASTSPTGAEALESTLSSTTAPAKSSGAAKATTPDSVANAAIAAPAVAAATQAIGNSATVIQNSLDNQTIQGSTTLTTTVNSLSTFHGINFQAGLQDALIRSR